MYLFVGLGNPGDTYQYTRHNAGFLCLDAYVAAHPDLSWKAEKKVFGEIAKTSDAILLKPNTFMNDSGRAVVAALSYYKIPREHLIIIHDELAFPLGALRLSPAGSAGGHNGVLSVIAELGNEQFTRLRMGIAPNDTRREPLADFVLKKLSEDEKKVLLSAAAHAAITLDKIIEDGIAKTMQTVNTEQ